MSRSEALYRRVALLLFFVLFSYIWVADKAHEEPILPIGNLSINELETYISVEGTIQYQEVRGETLFLRIEDRTGKLQAVVFNHPNPFAYEFTYRFEGTLTLYNDELELIVTKAQPLGLE